MGNASPGDRRTLTSSLPHFLTARPSALPPSRSPALPEVAAPALVTEFLEELPDQRVALPGDLGRREMPGVVELDVARARDGLVDLLLVLGRLAGVLEPAQQQQLRLE